MNDLSLPFPLIHRQRASKQRTLVRASRRLSLEQRFMFDGAAVVTAADAAHAAEAHAAAPAAEAAAAVQLRTADPSRDHGRKEVAFIDTSIAGYKTLEAGVPEGIAIVEIDGSRDGLAQMAKWAETHTGYDAIHILSHAEQGRLELGRTTLTDSSLSSAPVQAQWAAVGRALNAGGDLLIYGCDLAKGAAGDRFIHDLAEATGADVAASTDSTGAADKHANWVLEKQVGAIEATAFSVDGFDGTLASTTLTFEGGTGNFSGVGGTAMSFTETGTGTTFIFTAQKAGGGADSVQLGSNYGGSYHGAEDIYFGVDDIIASATVTIENGKAFTPVSFYISNQGFGDDRFVITTNKGGSYTSNLVPYSPFSSYQVTLPSTPGFQGITWFTISPQSGSSFVEVDDIALTNIGVLPTVTDARISLTSTGSGTGGAYKIGDTVTASWNNTAGGDNNAGITGVTMDFSQFGGGAAVAATDSSGTWTASYTITAGSVDLANRNVSVTASNSGNSKTTADSTNATVDNVAPTVTDGRINISGGSGTGGAYKIGDTVTATWNNTAGGDNNSDTISGVTVNFSAFGGGSAVAATNSSGTWTATYTLTAGSVDLANRNVSVTATDNAGNTTTTADSTNAVVDSVAPTVTDGRINISGGSGTGGAYKIGDTVTATWNNTAGGDNNTDTISGVTVDFSAFGGGSAVAATNSAGTWTATYTLVAGAVDAANRNVSVTATDNAGNTTTTADSTNATVDNVAPTVTDGRISLSGASGTGGAYKIGDTVTATWNNTAGGDNNSDTISGVTVDFSAFGGGSAVAATNSSGTWTATYTLVAGAIDAANRNVSVTATDNAGNTTTTADTTNATVDNIAPTVTDGRISISGGSGTGGAYKVGDTVTATWNNTAGGDNNTDTISGVTVDFTAFGGGSAVVATNSGGTWTATYTLVAGAIDATNRNVSVSVTDNAGNTTTTADSTNATVDNQAPAAPSAPSMSSASDTGASASDGITSNATPTFTGTAPANTAVMLYDTDGTTVLGSATSDGSGDWTITAATLSAGAHTVTARTSDAVGNASSASAGLAIVIDATAPAAPSAPDLASGSDSGTSSTDNITSTTSPTFTGTAEAGSTVTLYDTDGTTVLGSATATGGAWSITSSTLAAGSHTLTAKATDAAGNVSSASSSLSVTVDTTSPTALALDTATVPTSAATSGSGVATLSATDSLGITYALAAGDGTNDADNGSFSISGDALQVGASTLTAGTYKLYVSATDVAGNVAHQAFTLTVVDAPGVSAIVRGGGAAATVNTSTTSITYTVTFDQAVTGVDASDFAVTATGTANGTIASVTGSGTTYTVTVDTLSGDGMLRLDLNGSGTGIQSGASVAIASGYTAGEVYTLDHTAPAAPSTPDMAAGSDTGSSGTDNITSAATPTFTGTAESGSTVTLYDTDGTTVLGSATATGGTWSITASTLAAGSHTLTAKAVDAAGNVSSASSALTATVDTAAPTALALNTTTVAMIAATPGNGIATLSASDGLGITYALAAGNGTNDADNGSFNLSGTSLNVGASPLSAGTYHLYVSATDAAGNVAYQAFTLTVADAPSVSAIVRSGGAAAAVNAAASSISYTVTFDQSVTGVDASDFALTATGTASGTIASVTGSGTTYTVTVNTLSGDGTLRLDLNASGTGILSGASTAIGSGYATGQTYTVDRVAPATPSRPALTAGSDTGASASDGITRQATPTFTGTAEAGSTVTLYDSDGATALGSTTATGGNWSITTSALADGNHTVTAKASDSAGNFSAASSGQAITLDTSAPTAVGLGTTAVSSHLATSGAVLTTLSAADSLGVTFALATGNGTNDADNARFSVAGNTLTVGGSALVAGSYRVYVAATDVAGNTTSQALTLTIVDVPRATGIVRADAAPVPAGSSAIHYTVTFDQPVTGVDASDFSLAATGTASGHIASVTGSGTVYTVTVDTLGGDGTLRLDLNASGTGIQSGASIAIGAGYTAGEAYSVDRVAPAAPSRPALAAASDTGVSTSDGITQRNTPTFTGTADAGSTVTLLDSDGTTVLGSTVATGGTWTITTAALAAGTHTVSARASDAAGNVSAASTGFALSIDTTAPAITQIPAPPAGTYKAGDVLTFTVATSEAVHVTGTPQLLLAVGGGTRTATYLSGSDSSALVFGYTVQAGDNGALALNALQPNGGALTDAAGNALDLTLHDVGDLTGRVLDAAGPAVTAVEVPAAGSYHAQQELDFNVRFSENVTVDTRSGAPRLSLDIGGSTVHAIYLSGSGSDTLHFRYTVAAGLTDTDGIAVQALEANGSLLRNAAGNSATLALNAVASTAGLLVDSVAPAITFNGLALSADSGSSASDFITNVAAQTLTAQLSATPAAGERVYGSVDGGATWIDITARISGTTLTWTGITLVGSNSLQIKAVDTAGNEGAVTTRGYVLDTSAPAAPGVNAVSTVEQRSTLSGTATLAAGETLTVTVGGATYAVTPSAGQWTLDLATATPLSGSLSLAPGQSYGVTATARDAAGNAGVATSTLTVLEVPPPPPPPPAETQPVPEPPNPPDAPMPMAVPPLMTFLPSASPVAAILSPSTTITPLDVQHAVIDSGPVLASQSTPAISTGFQVLLRPAAAGDGGSNALVVNNPLPDQLLATGDRSQFTIPADAFAQSSASVVQLSAQLANGTPLPAWARFDPKTGKFTMEPPRGFTGELTVRVVARDAQGHQAVQVFKIRVGTDRPGRASLSEQLKGSTQAQHLAALQRLAQTTAQPWSNG